MDDCYVPSTYKDAMCDSWKLSDRGAGEPRISEDSGPFVTSWQVAAALWVLLGKPGGARARDVLRGFLAPGFWDLPASERWWTPPPHSLLSSWGPSGCRLAGRHAGGCRTAGRG